MLKYLNTKVTFAEVPDEITLCIEITGCKIGCKNCHSSYLAEDIGSELTFEELLKLYSKNSGITCISFMGGDIEPYIVNERAKQIRKSFPELKIAWYSGRQELSDEIELKNFDYIKLGPYIEEKGPLNNPNTNQRFYEINRLSKLPEKFTMKDITYKFWNNENKNKGNS